MTKEDFDRPEVFTASNPDSLTGYAHGPIPNNNPDWLLISVIERVVETNRTRRILLADIEDGLVRNRPPNPMVALSKVNGLVCNIEIFDEVMCGLTFNTQGELRRHLRNEHPGANDFDSKTSLAIICRPLSAHEEEHGRNALKRWVLSGGWRYASYLYEPGHGSEDSLVRQYCEALERIAEEDPSFAREYGTKFYRRPMPTEIALHLPRPLHPPSRRKGLYVHRTGELRLGSRLRRIGEHVASTAFILSSK